MCPVEIGPDGSPIIKSEPPITPIPPVTKDFKNPGDDTELTQLVEVEKEVPSHLLSREALIKAIEDVVRRYTSDTQSFQKCMAELSDLIPE